MKFPLFLCSAPAAIYLDSVTDTSSGPGSFMAHYTGWVWDHHKPIIEISINIMGI